MLGSCVSEASRVKTIYVMKSLGLLRASDGMPGGTLPKPQPQAPRATQEQQRGLGGRGGIWL